MLPETLAQLMVAGLNFATACVKGQTPEQAAKMWQWWIEFVEFWRNLSGVNK